MRMKRAAAFTLAGLMAVSMTACGSGNGGSAKGSTSDSTEETKNEAAATAGKKDASEKLVVWTLADDLKQFAERYCEKNPDVQIETVTSQDGIKNFFFSHRVHTTVGDCTGCDGKLQCGNSQ